MGIAVSAVDVAVTRPGRLNVDYRDDVSDRVVWFENGRVTIFDPVAGTYAEVSGPKDIDGMVAKLEKEYGMALPLGELAESNPDAVHVPRVGPINAWDHRPFVEAIEKTKRKTLLIAGTLTSICMAFPALSALAAGYKVFCIVDASGNWSKMATDITIARVTQAGAMPIDTFAVMSELMNTWNRPEAMDFAKVMIDHIVPAYGALMESYDTAQKSVR